MVKTYLQLWCPMERSNVDLINGTILSINHRNDRTFWNIYQRRTSIAIDERKLNIEWSPETEHDKFYDARYSKNASRYRNNTYLKISQLWYYLVLTQIPHR